MAPPTQAGKFKPRKPAKPIRVGAAGTSGVPIAVPSNSAPAAASQVEGSRNGSRPGRGGRGRGAGGRGAVPQGQVFFTGNAKPDANKRGSATSAASHHSNAGRGVTGGAGTNSRGSAVLSSKRSGTDVQEEVVGFMEEGVGSSRPGPVASERSVGRKYDDSTYSTATEPPPSAREKATGSAMDRYMYDSDSSDDEARPIRGANFLQPIQLPIAQRHAPDQESADRDVIPTEVTSTATDWTCKSPTLQEKSPFASVKDLKAIENETDGFFLCQLPTRLVPFRTTTDANMDAITNNAPDPPADQQTETVMSNVSVPAIQEDSFDNILSNAQPGRLGKLRVYKSGKTILELVGPSGTTVRMNVTEGLSCSFRQYIAFVDTDLAQLVTLGDVHKTVVVTPNLTESSA